MAIHILSEFKYIMNKLFITFYKKINIAIKKNFHSEYFKCYKLRPFEHSENFVLWL